MSDQELCKACGSSNTYFSPNGYDSVVVCNECHAELHSPLCASKAGNLREYRFAVVSQQWFFKPGRDGPKSKLQQVQDYLPFNYNVHNLGGAIIISGFDSHGWTLDGYVIPRLSSGLIPARELLEKEIQWPT